MDAAYLLTVVLFNGSDLSAYVSSFNISTTQDAEVDITGVGFTPDLTLFSAAATISADSTGNTAQMSFGMMGWDGATIDQRMYGLYYRDNVSTTTTRTVLYNNRIWRGLFGNTDAAEVTDVGADGFSVTTKEQSGQTTNINFLCLNFNGVAQHWLGSVTPPTTVSEVSETGPGFKPQFVFSYIGLAQTENSILDSDNGSYGIIVMDATNQFSNTLGDEDNQTVTSDTQNLVDNKAINLPDSDHTVGYEGTLTQFDAVGWTWDFTAVADATQRRWAAFAVEEVAEPLDPAPVDQLRQSGGMIGGSWE